MTEVIFFYILALATACIGAWNDGKTHRIPNRLTIPAAAAGLLLHLVLGGPAGFLDGMKGLGMGAVFILLWLMVALKAGDVKLYMAIGALGGWKFCLNTEIYSILVGGSAALFFMLIRKSGRRSLKNLWNYGINLILTRKFYLYEGEQDSYFCFGWCIAVGALLAMFVGIV